MNDRLVIIDKLVQKRRFATSFLVEYIEFSLLCLIAAGIPLFFRHPQLLVGVMVNTTLMVAAVNVRGWNKIIPIIILPSVAAAVGGFLFGALTVYLLILIPVIWCGNAILVFLMKYFYLYKHLSLFAAVPIASTMKMLVLFSISFLLVLLGFLPEMFLTAMGVMQLATALLGGMIAVPITKGYQHFFSESIR